MKLKQTLTAAALAAALATPAFAQQQKAPAAPTPRAAMSKDQKAPMAKEPNAENAMPNATSGMASASEQKAGFVHSQSANEWRGSRLIGATVYGSENESIGEINDVLIGKDGNIRAVVVGVGGFLGVGEKNVALPFEALKVRRQPGSSGIDKITVSYTKDQLDNAPQFAFYDGKAMETTGSGSDQPAMPMEKNGMPKTK